MITNLVPRQDLNEIFYICIYFQDTGCGVGGPARHIAAFTGSKITGITINDYQIKRANDVTTQAKLSHLVNYQRVCISIILRFTKMYSFAGTQPAAYYTVPTVQCECRGDGGVYLLTCVHCILSWWTCCGHNVSHSLYFSSILMFMYWIWSSDWYILIDWWYWLIDIIT